MAEKFPARRGRPSKADLTEAMREEILDRVSAGETLEEACRSLNGITPTEFRRWTRSGKAAREAWADARREHAHALFDRMEELAKRLDSGAWSKEDNPTVTALKGAIDTYKHITSRLSPDDYSDKRDVATGVNVTIVSTLPLGPGSVPEAAVDTAFRVVGKLPAPKGEQ